MITRLANLLANDGTGRFTERPEWLPRTWAGDEPNDVDLVDVDGDFDLDIIITRSHSDADLFTDVSVLQIPIEGRLFDGGISCADLDQDGDYDAVIWSQESVERVYRNDGLGTFSLDLDVFEPVLDHTLGGEIADLDGDGVLDAVTAQGSVEPLRNVVFWGKGPTDTRPPTLIPLSLEPRISRAFARADFGDGDAEIDGSHEGGDLFGVALPGLPEPGFRTEVVLCVVDEAGNEGCSAPLDYVSLGEPPRPPATGTTGETGGDTGSSTDSGAPAPPSSCGCATGGSDGLPIGFVVLLGVVRGWRRQPPNRAPSVSYSIRCREHARHAGISIRGVGPPGRSRPRTFLGSSPCEGRPTAEMPCRTPHSTSASPRSGSPSTGW